MYKIECFLGHENCSFIHVIIIGFQSMPVMCLKVISPKVMPHKTRIMSKIFFYIVQNAELCHLKFYHAQQK